MNNSFFKRGTGLLLAAVLTVSALPIAAFAAEEDGLCPHHPSHTQDCGYEASGVCGHSCSEASGCIAIRCTHAHDLTCYHTDGNLNCPHACTDVPECYTPSTVCVHSEHSGCGHTEGEDCSFAEEGCQLCENPPIALKGTDVTIDGFSFPYTGAEICPEVLVKVGDAVLIENTHYTLTYADNIQVGTGTVTVTGIPEGGYEGTVTIPFTITGAPEYTMVELTKEHVSMEEGVFAYTGEPIEPAVTVTVDGTALTAGKDYTVSYTDNVEPGTATVTIRGIATASETLGYTGEVVLNFTIVEPEKPEEPEQPTQPEFVLVELKDSHVSLNGSSFPYTGKPIEPAVTVTVDGTTLTAGKDYTVSYTNNVEPGTATVTIRGIATASETLGYTGEVTKTFTILREETRKEYTITKGSGAAWYQGSSKTLSFTADGSFQDFTGVSVDGKKLGSSYYTVGEGTVVTLEQAFLNKLAVDSYSITIHFADGDAKGTFLVKDGLDTTNPSTSDGFAMGLWITVMLTSIAGLGAAAVIGKKRFF